MPVPITKPTVLVVGAGPSGLVLACELFRHGVPCRIVDKAADATTQSRALGLQARTLEVFDMMGAVKGILAQAKIMHAMNAYADGRRIAQLTFDVSGDRDTPYPYEMVLAQSHTQRLLTRHLDGLGGHVEAGVELLSVDRIGPDGDDGYQVVLRSEAGDEALRCDWLVAADGASSAVRTKLGLAFTGDTYEQKFLLGDVRIDWNLSDDEGHIFLTPKGPLVTFPFPEPGRWRIIDTTNEAENGDPGAGVMRFQQLLNETGVQGTVSDPQWTSLFRFHRRMVDRYRHGRLFLIGDAAHIHSPATAQGLNTGVQDAFNLAWKLAQVAKGRAVDALLDSYEAERLPVARTVLRETDAMTRGITIRSPIAQHLRNMLVDFALGFETVRHRLARGMSRLDLNYRDSPVVAEDRDMVPPLSPQTHGFRMHEDYDFGMGPRPGDRAPNVDPRIREPGSTPQLLAFMRRPTHILLIFAGAQTPEPAIQDIVQGAVAMADTWRGLISAHVVWPATRPPECLFDNIEMVVDHDATLHRLYGAGATCLYLIRPDGYIAYRQQPIDHVKLGSYLRRLYIPLASRREPVAV